ncbi:alpha/beta hydrolase [Pantoea vagans]|uniref:alpha/beta hydrolase n=1 Tax=Pantoea vagans TaxID=470934 RepID=UPI0028F0FBCE|nr:alpha/beta hydrolase [Pantoea vagans]
MTINFASKSLFNGALLAGAMAMISSGEAMAQNTPGASDSPVPLVQTWDKTFKESNKVDHQKVTFKNRYGITLAADVYIPKNRGDKKLAAIVVAGPFGAVKEQASGLYAQTMAERGFVTLAFDPSYTGESSGEPRNIASPDINTEDFMAAVDFIGLQPYVDRERIGVIGICGMGGIALNAVAVDKRVKAVVASTMYDMSRVMSRGYNDSVMPEQREQALEKMSRQRWEDAANGKPAYQPAYNKLKGGEARFLVEYADYYMTPRGYHPRAVNSGNSWSVTTPMSFMNFPLMTYIKEISPRPVLFIHGDKAHSLYFSKTAYEAAAQPKELLIVKDATHVDLYDRMDKIPFAKMTDFFNQYLNK